MKNILYACLLLLIISVNNSCVKKTEACFTFAPAEVKIGTPVTFNSSCSTDATYFTWNFGDAATDKTVKTITTTHKYTAAGTYTIKLTAKRDSKSSAGRSIRSTTQTVTVQ